MNSAADDEPMIDLRIWGKHRGLQPPGTTYPVICHLLDAAAAAEALWANYFASNLKGWLAKQLEVDEDHCGRLLAFWTALHDIGKISPGFQAKVPAAFEVLRGTYPLAHGAEKHHDLTTCIWVVRQFTDGKYLDVRKPSSVIAAMLGGHHGVFPELSNTRLSAEDGRIGVGPWEKQRQATYRALGRILDEPAPPPRVTVQAAVIFCGLVQLADWLVSDTQYIQSRLDDVPSQGSIAQLAAFYADSRDHAPRLVSKAGLARLRLNAGSFTDEMGFAPHAVQASVAERLPELVKGPGLLIVPAPTGSGKTEVALHAGRLMMDATGASGLVFALPTMATADHMYRRVHEYLNKRSADPTSLTLVHGMAWLSPALDQCVGQGEGSISTEDDTMYVEAAEWLWRGKRGLLAPGSVITVDQALLAVLPVRFNVLRMAGLAGKVVIFDEVHAFDRYTRRLLCILLQWLGELGVPVVLLSATLPRRFLSEFVAAYLPATENGGRAPVTPAIEPVYPGWIYVDRSSQQLTTVPVPLPASETRNLQVTLRELTEDENETLDRAAALRAELAPIVDEGGNVLVICTTVAEAQDTYSFLCTEFSSAVPTRLFHARFPAWQREELSTEVQRLYGKGDGNRPHGSILVATQVVEQSLDVDFDLVISDLAPIELLLQRAGRCHRHAGRPRPRWAATPRIAVLVGGNPDRPRFPQAWTSVYPEAVLIRAHRLLAARGDAPISIPDDVQALIDRQHEDASLMDGIVGGEELETKYIADEYVRQSTANLVGVSSKAGYLHQVTDRNVVEELISTRFDADSVRALPVFVDADGDQWFDDTLIKAVPLRPRGRYFDKAELEEIIKHTVTVNGGSWLRDRPEWTFPPSTWTGSMLERLVVVPLQVRDGEVEPVQIGNRSFYLRTTGPGRDLGLVTRSG